MRHLSYNGRNYSLPIAVCALLYGRRLAMKQDLWRKAEELFHAALERPPEARRAFLDEACGEDTELRQQVEMLISKDEQAGSLLEKPVLADVDGFSMHRSDHFALSDHRKAGPGRDGRRL